MPGLTEQRKSLYRKLRTKAVLADPAQQEHIRAEISELSAQIKELRREVEAVRGYCPAPPLPSRIRYRPPVKKSPVRMRKARQEPGAGPGGSPRKEMIFDVITQATAAEQVVRMSLEGAEFALKITGSAAKNLAAALYTVLKDQKKDQGQSPH